jgi:eukaryotic-like serine/threonine-protein kinase
VTGEMRMPLRPRRRRALLSSAVALALAAAAAVGAWLIGPGARPSTPKPHVVALTRLAGVEIHPSFSPDGRQVAFAWNGERQDNFDIYVQLVGSSEVRRLSTHPKADLAPAWSPDGRSIAYVRVQAPGTPQQLRVVSVLGGSDRAVGDVAAWQQPSWSPDGRYLAAGLALRQDGSRSAGGIHLFPLDGGEPFIVTEPPSSSIDQSPAFAPDGRRLAYASCRNASVRMDCHVNVLNLDAAYRPVGAPTRLTTASERAIRGITWCNGGTLLVYSAGYLEPHLWRVPADGSSPPTRLQEAEAPAANPSCAPSADRMVFSRRASDSDIFTLHPGREPVVAARSSGFDGQPDYAPDGERIAFCSDRSGSVEVWTARHDGSAPSQVTRGPGREQCSPAWSPDGRRVAFDSVDEDGFWQIWTIAPDGGEVQRVTRGAADHNVPSWSRDGEWVYFSRRDSRGRNIWRAHVPTGRMTQLTEHGSGYFAHESSDGSGIVYPAHGTDDAPLMFRLFAGGNPQVLIPCVAGGSTVSVRPQGIYFLPCQQDPWSGGDQPIHVFDPVTGEHRRHAVLTAYNSLGRDAYGVNWFRKVAVSPDGERVAYAREVLERADLMLVENFR